MEVEDYYYVYLVGVFNVLAVMIATLLSLRFEIPFNVGLREMSAAVAGVELSVDLRLPIFKADLLYDTYLNF